MNIRLATKWDIDCVQSPIAFVRIHGQNETILNKEREISEFKTWYNEMKNNKAISSNKAFNNIFFKINYLEIMQSILTEGSGKNLSKVIKYPLGLNKIKLILALFLPKFILRIIKDY